MALKPHRRAPGHEVTTDIGDDASHLELMQEWRGRLNWGGSVLPLAVEGFAVAAERSVLVIVMCGFVALVSTLLSAPAMTELLATLVLIMIPGANRRAEAKQLYLRLRNLRRPAPRRSGRGP
jgi:hypothetical protein